MSALLDNLAALMIGASILLMLLAMQQQAQESALLRTLSYTAKKSALDFGEWMQEDLANVGAGLNLGDDAIVDREENAEGLTRLFHFRRLLEPDDVSATDVVYVLQARDTVEIDEEQVVLYQLERRLDSEYGDVTGQSTATLTDFHIDMIDGAGAETDFPDQARQLRIRFSASMMYNEREHYLRQTHWSTMVPLRVME